VGKLSKKLVSLLMVLLLIFAYFEVPSGAETHIPGNVRATADSTSITLVWDEVVGAIAYEVEADGVVIEDITTTSYEDKGLMPETEHTYRVRAVNGEITGEWSEQITVTTLEEPGEVPGVVNNVTAIAGSTSITLSWDEVAGATTYEVEADGIVIGNTTGAGYEVTELVPETEYTYRVRAKDGEMVGEWSEQLTVSTISDPGQGTQESPFVITTRQQLEGICNNPDAFYLLGDNIDLENEEWVTSQYEFSGSLDGNGYTISNLKITRSSVNNIGLFGSASGAAIRNLNLNNVDIRGANNVGGLVGYSKANTVIEDCSITGISQITGTGSIGGIVGYLDSTTILRSCSTANVTGTAGNIGGLAGYNHSGSKIMQSFSSGHVSGQTAVGGILGCKGSIGSNTRIEDSYSLGNVTAATGCAGGIIASSSYVDMKNCYAAGQVTGAGAYVGGIFGYITNNSRATTATNCYFDSTIMGFTTPAAQAKTTEQLMQQATFINWDFSSVWNIDEGSTYPFLRALGYPKELKASDITNRSITLSWNEIPNAASYDIEIDRVVQNNITGTTHTFTGLSPGTKYKFRIRTKYSNGQSNWSPIVTVITLLDTPENVALAVSEDSIHITWGEVEMANSYLIEVDGVIIDDLFNTSYLHNELAPNVQHTYRIKAANDVTSSAWTDVNSAINWAADEPGLCLAASNWIYEDSSTDDIEVSLKANNVSDMYTIQMDLEYDTQITNMAEESLNYLLWSENENTYISMKAENQDGRVKILGSKTGDEEGQTGNFDVLNMRFRIVSGNIGCIKVNKVRIVDSKGEFIYISEVQDLYLRIFQD